MARALKKIQYQKLRDYIDEQIKADPQVENPELKELARTYCTANFGVSPGLDALNQFIWTYRKEHPRETKSENISIVEGQVLECLKAGKARSLVDIANTLNVGPRVITETIASLQNKGYSVDVPVGEENVKLEKIQPSPEPFRKLDINNYVEGEWQKFGLVSDTHLCSNYERLDVVHAMYDLFEAEGIDIVYLPGNYIDGVTTFNMFELKTPVGFDKQMDYFFEKFPYKPGIKTYFIDADEHEGWYFKREGIIPGRHLEYMAKDMDRDDLIYLGYLESDVSYLTPEGNTIVRLFHPKRGTAYAISYSSQKIVESYQGGEKPDILLVGHFHKAEYMPHYRNIHIIQAGCCQDQSTFMRGKSIEAHVGGWIIQFKQRPDGSVCRLRAEFIGFYDRKYHIKHEFSEETS